MSDKQYKAFGDALKLARRAYSWEIGLRRKLTAREVAHKIRVSPNLYEKYESGLYRTPRDVVYSLCVLYKDFADVVQILTEALVLLEPQMPTDPSFRVDPTSGRLLHPEQTAEQLERLDKAGNWVYEQGNAREALRITEEYWPFVYRFCGQLPIAHTFGRQHARNLSQNGSDLKAVQVIRSLADFEVDRSSLLRQASRLISEAWYTQRAYHLTGLKTLAIFAEARKFIRDRASGAPLLDPRWMRMWNEYQRHMIIAMTDLMPDEKTIGILKTMHPHLKTVVPQLGIYEIPNRLVLARVEACIGLLDDAYGGAISETSRFDWTNIDAFQVRTKVLALYKDGRTDECRELLDSRYNSAPPGLPLRRIQIRNLRLQLFSE